MTTNDAWMHMIYFTLSTFIFKDLISLNHLQTSFKLKVTIALQGNTISAYKQRRTTQMEMQQIKEP